MAAEVGNPRQEAMVAGRLYSLLDTLITALVPAEAGIKPGGYAEEIFDDGLNEEEKNDFECSICFNILRDCRQCKNGHKFCASCIFVWSMQPADVSDKCPICRCSGDYTVNRDVNEKLSRKIVNCKTDECNWKGCLVKFEGHVHREYNEQELASSTVFDSVRPATSSDEEIDYDDEDDEDEDDETRCVNGGITLHSSQNFSLPKGECFTGTYTIAQRSSEFRDTMTPGEVAVTPPSALPSIRHQPSQISSYSVRPPSGTIRNGGVLPDQPLRRRPPSATMPPTPLKDLAMRVSPRLPVSLDRNMLVNLDPLGETNGNMALPRPPSAPRPQMARTQLRNSSSSLETTSEIQEANPLSTRADQAEGLLGGILSRPQSSRLNLPPLGISQSPMDTNRGIGEDRLPDFTNRPAPPVPLALPIRRSLPIPLTPRRPVAPTQPAALSQPNTARIIGEPAPNKTIETPIEPIRRELTIDQVPNPTGSGTANVGGPETRSTADSVETSRDHLLQVRSKLLASRQQVATILGIIAYEMQGRRRMQANAEMQGTPLAPQLQLQNRSRSVNRQLFGTSGSTSAVRLRDGSMERRPSNSIEHLPPVRADSTESQIGPMESRRNHMINAPRTATFRSRSLMQRRYVNNSTDTINGRSVREHGPVDRSLPWFNQPF